MNIKNLIGEATEYDKKLVLEEKNPKSWCKSVSAFANTFGGALIFGISNEGKVVGLEDPEGDAEKISEVVKTKLDPIHRILHIRWRILLSRSLRKGIRNGRGIVWMIKN